MTAKKRIPALLLVFVLLSVFISSCGNNQDTEVAVIVALTQTAAALQQPASSAPELLASPTAESAPLPTPTLASSETLPVAIPGYQPLDPNTCEALNNALIASTGISGNWEYPVPFQDFIKGESGLGCQITFSTTGASITDMMGGLYDPAQTTLQGLGWVEDTSYGAGGPLALATGYRKETALCLVSVKGVPVDRALCPSDQPIGMCWEKLTPEQKILTLNLNCSVYNP
jgi:hypothetical protein